MIPIYYLGDNSRYRLVETTPDVVERAVANLRISDLNLSGKGRDLIQLLSTGQASFSQDTFTIFAPKTRVQVPFSDNQPYHEGVLDFFSSLSHIGEERSGDGVLIDEVEFSAGLPQRKIGGYACVIKRAQ